MIEDEEFGDIATKVLYENERVRIWEMRIPPGEESDLHKHELDNILVQISGDRIAVVPHPDTQSPFREYLEADVVPGRHVYQRRGGIERARNVGKETYVEILIELKD